MYKYRIIEITDANIDSLQKLAEEQSADGSSSFVTRTIAEWKSGQNNFSKHGEKLWGMVIDNELVGIGGINQDPFSEDTTLGRVRHVYIAKKYRGQGLSKVIMNLIISRAKEYFKSLRLATKNPVAVSLYESLGFVQDDSKTPPEVKAQFPDRHTYYLYW